jgi:hypothetical protein
VMFQWGWNYVTRKRGAQIITSQPPSPHMRSGTGNAEHVSRIPRARLRGLHADGGGR